jgi:putative phosphoesterase
MRIGVVSDTHGYFDPRLLEFLAGVEGILHAGDVGSQNVLDELARIAPLHAVRGNVDPDSLDLPPALTRQFEDVRVEVIHQLPMQQSELQKWADGELLPTIYPARRDAFLKAFGEMTRVVIFGHTHRPCLLAVGHRLFFNPGSAGARRFSLPRSCGILEVFPRGVRGTLVSLERYNERLPSRVWLPVGG